MSPLEVLRELARLDVVVIEENGGPVLDGIFGEALVDAVRANRWLATWGLEGARGGRDPSTGRWRCHTWHACDACAQVQLLDPQRKQARPCSLTVGCSGRMRPVDGPKFQPADIAGPAATAATS